MTAGADQHDHPQVIVCGHRWYGPRVDVFGAPAHHVCFYSSEESDPPHAGYDEGGNLVSFGHHRCICGATSF